MLTLCKVAVTGAIGSGKSTVCAFFEECGAFTISSDRIVHQLLSPKTDLGKELVGFLGKDVLVNDHFDHQMIAAKVFQEPKLLTELEKRVHPEVLKEIERAYACCLLEKKHSLFVAEVPLLFEAHFERYFDKVIVVTCDPTLSQSRFLKKGTQTVDDYERRVARLKPIEEKIKKADFVITNDGSKENLKEKTKKIYQQLTKL